MIKIVIILTLLMFISGCNIFGIKDLSEKYTYRELEIERVELPDSVKLGKPIPLRVRGVLPDVSWSFDRFEIQQDEHWLSVRIFGKKDTEIDVVIMLPVICEEATEINVDESGSYYFHFPRNSNGWDLENSGRINMDKCVMVVP